MTSVKSAHERKVNKSHAWDRIHGDLGTRKSARISAKSIPDNEVIELALSIGWTPNPCTDLIRAIIQKWNCSDNVAGKVYSRVIESLVQYENHDKIATVWRWETKQKNE